MTVGELLAVGMLAVGGFLLSFHKGKVKKKLVALMLLSSALMAGYDVILIRVCGFIRGRMLGGRYNEG